MPRMSIQSRVSRNIQRIRREKDLWQEEVAHRADIHQTYLSGVETGKRNPSILVVERIAKANPELAKARKPRTPWQWVKGSAAEKEARKTLSAPSVQPK
jgi:predicted transcriptional regulator